jgi:hypothetical protein
MNAEGGTGWLLDRDDPVKIELTPWFTLPSFSQSRKLCLDAFLICVHLRNLRPENGPQDSGRFDLIEWI